VPDQERRKHWLMFGGMAIIYILVGIGIRHAELQRGEGDRQRAQEDRQRAAEDRQNLRGIRTTMDTRMDGVFSSFQSTYLQLASLSSDLHNMRVGLTQAINSNDPHRLAELETKAQTAQQQVNALSSELLALTMTPQIAQQLRDWEMESKAKQHDLHLFAYEDEMHYKERNPNDDGRGFDQMEKDWDAAYDKANRDAIEELKRRITTADFIRREMLQRVSPQQQSAEDKKQEPEFAQAKSDPESLSREKAARYLEGLARRVPPPK
jgi:hypothetical protein